MYWPSHTDNGRFHYPILTNRRVILTKIKERNARANWSYKLNVPIDIHRIFHPNTKAYTFFSVTRGTSWKIEQYLDTALHHIWLPQENKNYINNRKFINLWKLNSHEWKMVQNRNKFKKSKTLGFNMCTAYTNLWDTINSWY